MNSSTVDVPNYIMHWFQEYRPREASETNIKK